MSLASSPLIAVLFTSPHASKKSFWKSKSVADTVMSFFFSPPLVFHILRLLRRSAYADYKNSGVLLETFTTSLPVRGMILTGKPVLSGQKKRDFPGLGILSPESRTLV